MEKELNKNGHANRVSLVAAIKWAWKNLDMDILRAACQSVSPLPNLQSDCRQ